MKKLRERLNILFSTALVFVTASSVLFLASCEKEEHVHEWSEWETFIPSTCFVVGQEKSTCACGEEKFRDIPLSHDFKESGTDIQKKSTVYTCSICGTEMREDLTYEDLGLPIVSFYGSMKGITTSDRVTLDVKYESSDTEFEAKASIKIQGATSTTYPKKNYSIKFLDKDGEKLKISVLDKWGSHSKYCLKANYIDVTQARNVVSAKLYGQIAKTREKADVISTLTNGGAIDGFPVAVYLNNEFLGLYTFNTAKDEYLFDIKKKGGAKSAILSSESFTDQTMLRSAITGEVEEAGFDLEYNSTDTDTAWLIESFNEMIAFVNNNDGFLFRQGLSNYIDVDRAIDEMLFIYLIGGSDNISKNMLWVTYDGKVWIPSPYDLDSTWGLKWNAEGYIEPGSVKPGYPYNVLWGKLEQYFENEVSMRWAELRRGPVTVENIEKMFRDFMSLIPDDIYGAEKEKWTELPLIDSNNFEQIIEYAKANIAFLDDYYQYKEN